MIKIDFCKNKIDLDGYDTLIFTSKNAVKALASMNPKWMKKEIYSIGPGTSREIQKHNANLVFTAKHSYGNSFAQEIKTRLQNKKVLFLRAKEVLSDLSTILKNAHVDLDEQIVYETQCQYHSLEQKPPAHSIVIFTSPSTYRCFVKNFAWDESYKAVAIGSVTAASIPKGIALYLAEEQTIQSCVDLAKSI